MAPLFTGAAAGLILGLAFFAALERLVRAQLSGGGWRRVLFWQILRPVLATGGFAAIAELGGFALLAGLGGFLLARGLQLARPVR
jgi:hypothetical protein